MKQFDVGDWKGFSEIKKLTNLEIKKNPLIV